jgi:pyruvate dehydrogenase E2 component (dihydrolipoamide acetyltransferase)
MAQPVIVPRESEEMEVCQILAWHVRRGEHVQTGALLCEVDTGKATFDLEAPAEGELLEIFYDEGEEAPLLTPIAVIGTPGEDFERFRPSSTGTERALSPSRHAAAAAETTAARTAGADTAAPKTAAAENAGEEGSAAEIAMAEAAAAGTAATKRAGGSSTSPAVEAARRKPASPRARRLAARQGIALDRIEGSGPGGAVVERDVRGWMGRLHGETKQ